MSKGKKIRKNELQQYKTLDKFLTPIIEKFSYKPDKDFARYLFGTFNEQKIYYYALNGEMCFTLKEFAKYISMTYDSVKKSFNRQSKKSFDDNGEFLYAEGRDYFKVDRGHFLPKGQNVPMVKDEKLGKKTGKKIVMLTFLGTWKLLPTFRSDIPIRLYHWFGEKLYSLIKSNKLTSGEFFFTNKYLKIFSFINGYRTLNKGLYHLIESEMTEITIQQLREEIEQREQKLSRLNKNLQVSEGGY